MEKLCFLICHFFFSFPQSFILFFHIAEYFMTNHLWTRTVTVGPANCYSDQSHPPENQNIFLNDCKLYRWVLSDFTSLHIICILFDHWHQMVFFLSLKCSLLPENMVIFVCFLIQPYFFWIFKLNKICWFKHFCFVLFFSSFGHTSNM